MQLIYETGRVSRSSAQSHSMCGFSDLSKVLAHVQGKAKLVCIGRKGSLPRTSSAVFVDRSTEARGTDYAFLWGYFFSSESKIIGNTVLVSLIFIGFHVLFSTFI